jgi:diguanylate cyclase (GGDEF)-like protein
MHIALVDPSRTVLKIVTRMLAARDYVVRPFIDGNAALEHIRSDTNIGALITSAEPLSLSGVELCWQTRLLANERRPIYIILMSANQDRRQLVEALDGGADDFIGKPPVPEELYARLRAAERLASMQNELIRLATTDPLTGTPNRRVFFERAQKIWTADSHPGALSAIMMDIDKFKQVNDEYGHAAGDEAIRAVARIAAAESEIVSRFGGEEFAVLLPGRDLVAACEVAERMRRNVEALRFMTDRGWMTMTCSFGVSELLPDESIDHLLHRADGALYAGKTRGRNRVVAADEMAAGNGTTGAVRTRAFKGD